jgi:hypothetical protein
MLVQRCQNLECLELQENYWNAGPLFTGSWPNLTTFAFGGEPTQHSDPARLLQSFVDAHPKLEHIHVERFTGPVPVTRLPLRSLTLKSVNTFSPHALRSLVCLEYLCVDDVESTDTQVYSRLPALRSLVLLRRPPIVVVRLIEQHLWHLEKLHMEWPFGPRCREQKLPENNPDDVSHWLYFYSQRMTCPHDV